MTTALLVIVIVIVAAYLLINGAYLVNALLAVREMREVGRELSLTVAPEAFASQLTPGVSILVPCRNEESGIADTVHSLLALRYPRYEVIVLDGGSTDRTREVLTEEFGLVPAHRAVRDTIPTGEVGEFMVSTRFPDLWLLCKPGVGKADALNVGVKTARHPYIATVDADALLEQDALLGAIQPILADPSVIGTGGMVRALNGCVIERGRVVEVRLPGSLVAALQIAEYLRSFLLMRTPLSGISSVLIISGAFGVFRRDLVEEVGGYYTSTAADDVEIVVHLYRHARETGRPQQRVVFLPEPVCWTEVPDTLAGLMRQRRRWHRGIAEVMWRHRRVLFRRRYGRLGWLALPYLSLELIGPPIELFAWVVVIAAWLLGVLSVPVLLLFLAVSFTLSLALTVAALVLAEVGYRRHAVGRETIRMLGYAFLETVGYRQLVSAACTFGVGDFLRRRQPYRQPARRTYARR